jgi:hypothetical protein
MFLIPRQTRLILGANVPITKGFKRSRNAKRFRIIGPSRLHGEVVGAEEETGWGAMAVQLLDSLSLRLRVDFP